MTRKEKKDAIIKAVEALVVTEVSYLKVADLKVGDVIYDRSGYSCEVLVTRESSDYFIGKVLSLPEGKEDKFDLTVGKEYLYFEAEGFIRNWGDYRFPPRDGNGYKNWFTRTMEEQKKVKRAEKDCGTLDFLYDYFF